MGVQLSGSGDSPNTEQEAGGKYVLWRSGTVHSDASHTKANCFVLSEDLLGQVFLVQAKFLF